MGKFLAIVLVTCGIIAGGAMYYLQVYAYYSTVVPNGASDVVLTPLDGSDVQAINYSDFTAIDSNSSPIRYRACFAAQNTAEAKLIVENKLRKFKNPTQLQKAVIGDIHFIEVKEV